MSKIAFQSRISIDVGYYTDAEMKVWVMNTTFTDGEFVYTGFDIQVGDVIAFDTSMYEPGTFTFYQVTNVVTPHVTNPVLEITYMPSNDNSWGAPALDSMFGTVQTISRPSTKLKLLPVVSKDTQGVSDRYTEYVQNYNFTSIVDNLISGDMTFTKINGEAYPLIKGMAVYITEVDQANCKTAVATTITSSRVLGLVADAAVVPGGTVTISSKGMLEKPVNDWDIITGETGGLRAGMDYFLRTDLTGGISSIPPIATNNFVVKVGKAVSPTVLDINIEPPIEL